MIKDNVLDISTRKKKVIKFTNTDVHIYSISPCDEYSREGILKLFNGLSKYYGLPIEDFGAHLFIFNKNSSEDFVKNEIIKCLKGKNLLNNGVEWEGSKE